MRPRRSPRSPRADGRSSRCRHPEDRAVQVHVLEPGQLGVEPGADLEQGPDVARHLDPPRGGRRDAAEDLQQRALARAVLADNPHGLAVADVEASGRRAREPLALHAPPRIGWRARSLDDFEQRRRCAGQPQAVDPSRSRGPDRGLR